MSACLRFDPNPFENTFCRACYKKKDKHQSTDISRPEGRINASGITKEPSIIHPSPGDNKDEPNVNDELHVLAAEVNNLDLNQIEEPLLQTTSLLHLGAYAVRNIVILRHLSCINLWVRCISLAQMQTNLLNWWRIGYWSAMKYCKRKE